MYTHLEPGDRMLDMQTGELRIVVAVYHGSGCYLDNGDYVDYGSKAIVNRYML